MYKDLTPEAARAELKAMLDTIAEENLELIDVTLPAWRVIEKGLHTFDLRKQERLLGLGRDEVINLRRLARIVTGAEPLTLAAWEAACRP